MNSYANTEIYDGCPACQMLLEGIGPVHGPEKPPPAGVDRWSMSPREWAGEGPLKYWGS